MHDAGGDHQQRRWTHPILATGHPKEWCGHAFQRLSLCFQQSIVVVVLLDIRIVSGQAEMSRAGAMSSACSSFWSDIHRAGRTHQRGTCREGYSVKALMYS